MSEYGMEDRGLKSSTDSSQFIEEEYKHYSQVARAMKDYSKDAEYEILRVDENLLRISKDCPEMLGDSDYLIEDLLREGPMGFDYMKTIQDEIENDYLFDIKTKGDDELYKTGVSFRRNLITAMRYCVSLNQEFLDLMIAHEYEVEMRNGGDEQQNGGLLRLGEHFQGENSEPTNRQNMSKVRSVLRQFVRDWGVEGELERKSSYYPLLDDLDKYFGDVSNKENIRVLIPGCGLGRLPFEVAMKGYTTEGNEVSYFVLIGSSFMLNSAISQLNFTIYPYCLSTCNLKHRKYAFRPVKIPDISPATLWSSISNGTPVSHRFSMCAGDFVELYCDQRKQWDAVMTSFFLDTARNPLIYIKTIASTLKFGGYWFNVGPLLYHYADQPCEISIELAWNELEFAISRYFSIVQQEWRDSTYSTDENSMKQTVFHCIHFAAQRNERPT